MESIGLGSHMLPSIPSSNGFPWRKTLFALAFVFVSLVSLLVVFYAGEKSRDLRAWDEYVAKARAEGRKLTLAGHLQPDIPDEENFAAAPIFVDLFARREASMVAVSGLWPNSQARANERCGERDGNRPGTLAQTASEGWIARP